MPNRSSQNRLALLVGTTLLVIGALLWGAIPVRESPAPLLSGAVIVFVLAVAAEIRPVRVKFGDAAYGLIPYELAHVVGLFLLPPRTLVLAQLAASTAVRLVKVRRSPAKSFFNTALAAFSAAVMALTATLASPMDGSLRSWLAIVLGIAATQVLSNGIVIWLVSRYGQEVVRSEMARSVALAVIMSAVLGTATWTVLVVGTTSPRLLLPTALIVVAMLPLVRGAVNVVHRANGYERLLRFTTAVVGPDDGRQLQGIVSMMRAHLGADAIQLAFREHPGDRHATVVVCTDQSYDERNVPIAEIGTLWALQHDGSAPLRVGPGNPGMRPLLGASSHADIVVTRNVESMCVWACIGGDDPSERESSGNQPTVKFPAMAEQVFTWLALQRHIQESEYLATHDPLTGLANRELLREAIQGAIDQAVAKNTSCAALILDLDYFKLVNDSWGHAIGDLLLVHVARAVEQVLPPGTSIGRLSGDEFVVLLRDCDEPTAMALAAEIGQAVRTPFCPADGVAIEAVASIGVALAPADTTDASRLMHLADSAMYYVKQSGATDRLVRYEAGRDARVERRAELKKAVECALAADAVRIVYQPLYDLETGHLVKFEALARMSPDGVEVAPSDFIPVAEATGLIHQLTARILDMAGEQLRQWAEFDVQIAVNLSVHNLMDRNFAASVSQLLRRCGVPPDRLICEVTESTVMRDPDLAIATLEQIRALGVAVSIDDFGTGHSSMQYLATLPVDEVKIDRSFVARAARPPVPGKPRRDLNVLEGLISLCRRLGLTVTVEGLETMEHVELVRGLGAQVGQGFVLARPMPVAEATVLLHERAQRRAVSRSTM